MARRIPTTRRPTYTFWDWLALYVTGFLLIVFILIHMVVEHYLGSVGSGDLSFDKVADRFQTFAFQFINLSLLALALVHGLWGTRRFVADLEILPRRGMQVFTLLLVALGIGGFYYGVVIFQAFLD